MKTLENKKTVIVENGKTVTYFDFFEMSLNKVNAQTGMSISEMEVRLPIISKIKDKELASVEVEDAEFNKIKECFSAMTWGGVLSDIVECDHYLKSL